jgi:hypothetical protein
LFYLSLYWIVLHYYLCDVWEIGGVKSVVMHVSTRTCIVLWLTVSWSYRHHSFILWIILLCYDIFSNGNDETELCACIWRSFVCILCGNVLYIPLYIDICIMETHSINPRSRRGIFSSVSVNADCSFPSFSEESNTSRYNFHLAVLLYEGQKTKICW